MESKSIIDRGLRWIIRNGKSVNVWRDRWLPTPNSFKVVSPRSQGLMVERVEHLLDRERGSWDIKNVRNTFSPLKLKLFWGYQSARVYLMIPEYGRGLIMGDSMSRARMR